MPKDNQILSNRFSDTVFFILQISIKHQKFEHALVHITEQPTLANATMSWAKTKMFSVIYGFFLGSSESQDIKYLMKDVTILM